MPKEGGATERKWKKFAGLYLETGSAQAAALECYNCKNKDSAKAMGYRMMQRPEVRKYINEALGTRDITPEFVLGRIKKVADHSKSETTQLRALELLGKYLKMFSEDTKKTLNLNIDLTHEQANKILRSETLLTGEKSSRVDVIRDNNDAGV